MFDNDKKIEKREETSSFALPIGKLGCGMSFSNKLKMEKLLNKKVLQGKLKNS